MFDTDERLETGSTELVEGTARVVEVTGAVAWLEPEATTSCGGCAASGACGAKGIGTIANRVAARRFPLRDHPELRVGDRVVVGVRGDALVKAALTAYAMPLVTLFLGGGLAQWAWGTDATTIAASVGGLLFGLVLARLGAGRLFASGASAPRFLRRVGQAPQTCQII
ncbi:SoxR reducing system RseC family protein [uncultured Thiodictyon sp.]|uniref:SoxR reducing system RseC family protein n=1 Tax=uncultured Thiodictyon sp. TaxID=1846217 RepID=UPI0025D5C6E1|nr:SoxR reducing system RseC family protein [uncultured Thiodictyon sp.]